ncbi:MAG: hypothetical protein LBO69_04125 [Ignavibacteria bacterium]|jgi:outer membrane protein OmpA-like peptidoglycan-associated protein|nr:hypothetical protein [Ignavibacteria bacterium]
MKLQKILIWIFLLLLAGLYTNPLLADEYTNHKVSIGGSANWNIYQSDFYSLPGVLNSNIYDNVKCDFTTGFGYAIRIGYGYEFTLWDMPATLGGDIVFTDLSAKYSEDAKFTNWIDGDNYGDAISRHILDISLQTALLNPYISLYPIDKHPLSFRLGLNLGINISGSYDQKEELVSPDNIEYSNGSNSIYVESGDLPDKSALYAGIQLGVGYDIAQIGNWVITPNILLNYGLTNIVSGLSWQAHSANIGITFTYKFPVYTPPPPELPKLPAPPALPLPKPPEVAKLELVVDASERNNETIYVPVNIDEIITTRVSMPILYFKNGTDTIISGYAPQLLDLLRNNKNISVEIGVSYPELSDADDLSEKRKIAINSFLQTNGINAVTTFSLKKDEKQQKYPELNQEYAYAKFYVNGKYAIVEHTRLDTAINQIGSASLSLEAKIVADATPYQYKLDYYIDGRTQSVMDEKWTLTLNQSNLKWTTPSAKSKLDIRCHLQDAEGKNAEQHFDYTVVPQLIATTYTNSKPDNAWTDEYVVGFFGFDESVLLTRNDNAINIIRKALAQGKLIEVVGTTDAFGTQQYNIPLSVSRANAAIAAIDTEHKWSSQIQIGNSNKPSHTNGTIYDRQHERAAIIRIMAK